MFTQACSQGGSVGSDKPLSQIKGLLKGPLFTTKAYFLNTRSLFSPACKQKVHYKETIRKIESPLPKKGPSAIFYIKGPIYIQNIFSFV